MPLRRVFIGAFASLVVLFGVWAGAHFVRPLPDPHWSTSDLPALPPERDNVHALLDARISAPDLDTLIVDDDRDAVEEARRVLDEGHAREPELVEALAPTRELRAEIRRRPRFVESSGMLGRSRVLEGIAVWRLRALSVLLDAIEEEHELAAEEVASMWTHAVDYSSHCQSLISCMAGQRMLQLTLGAAEIVAASPQRDLAWLALLIETSTLDRSAIAHGVIAEYVYARVALETYEAPLLDRAHTDALLASHFESAVAFARDGRQPRPDPDFSDRPLWWLYNPAGKTLATNITVEHIDATIERYGREADAIAQRRDAVVASLRGRSARRAADGAAWQLAREDARAMRALHAPEAFGRGERE